MRNYLQINSRFQNSINFSIDSENIDLINNYIPTESFMSFVEYYLGNIQNKNNNTTMLVAPYGKGKSHALLVIMHLLSHTNYSNIEQLLKKIKKLDSTYIKSINNLKNKKYMPVIINSTRDNINQAMLQGLKDAIEKQGIVDFKLNSDFEHALERICSWKNDFPTTYDNYVEALRIKKVTPIQLESRLNLFEDKAMELFCEIHIKILSGVPFVVDKSHEVVDYYREVEHKVVNEYGYDGLFIVFDEFTKFIESRNPKTVSNDMKVIQDIAELSNSSDCKMYFTMIMHKTIREYINIDEAIKNAFKGIEGRALTQYYTSTEKDEFKLVENVLQKKDDYYKDYVKSNKHSIDVLNKKIIKLPCFYTLFSMKELKQLIIECYPLHPVSMYLLIKVSEKIAQNERSLFTYLTRKSKYTLLNTYNNEIVYADSIFDYFSNLLASEDNNPKIKQIYYNASSICNTYEDETTKIIIKTLALIQIINSTEALSPTISSLSIACDCEEDEVRIIVDKLVFDNKLYL